MEPVSLLALSFTRLFLPKQLPGFFFVLVNKPREHVLTMGTMGIHTAVASATVAGFFGCSSRDPIVPIGTGLTKLDFNMTKVKPVHCALFSLFNSFFMERERRSAFKPKISILNTKSHFTCKLMMWHTM